MKVLGLIAWAALLFAAPPIQAQTLTDPGFETAGPALVSTSDAASKAQISGTLAQGWQDNTNLADVQIAYALDSAHSRSGQFSQKITVTRGFAQTTQPVAFRAARYRASIWIRAQPTQWVSLTLREEGAPYDSYGSAAIKVGPHWTQVTAEGDTPVIQGGLFINTTVPGTIWLDDAALTVVPRQAQRLSPPSSVIPRVFFGLNVNHMHDSPGFDWPVLDFGSYRTWDSGVIWPNIETARGVYNWTDLDKDVAEANAHHTQFLFTLGQTPTWASSRPDEPAAYGKGYGAPPAKMQDWRDFIRAVATRYRGRIQAYEVWNEPDLKEFYTGTPAQLAALERATEQVVHQVDPHALVVAAPASGGEGSTKLQFLDAYYSAGGGKNADVLAFHGYNYPAESEIESVRTFQALVKAHGLQNKPIWETETGTDLSQISEADTAAFVGQEFVLDWALGIKRLYLYAYDSGFTGLDKAIPGSKRRDPTQLDLSGQVYQNMEHWLTGAKMLSCGSDTHGNWMCVLLRPDGSRARITWNAAHPIPVYADQGKL
jgi:hypothetical protein